MSRLMPLLFVLAVPIVSVPVRAAAAPAWDQFTGRPLAHSQAVRQAPSRREAPDVVEAVAAPAMTAITALPSVRMKVRLDGAVAPRTTLAISDQADDVRRCYQRAFSRIPDLAGELTVSLDVGQGGRTHGEVLVDDTGDWQLVSCVNDATAHWLVPDATGPLRLKVTLRPA